MEAYCTSTWGMKADIMELDISVRCNSTQWALYIANHCSKDSQSGSYCGEAVAYIHEINEILSVCSPSRVTFDGCSPECALRLKTIRNDFGCCINTIFNNTDSIFEPSYLSAFNYSLWSSCGVEPVTSVCEFSRVLYDAREAAPLSVCTSQELDKSHLDVSCSPFVMKPIFDLLQQEENCDIYMEYYNNTCSQDENGSFCLVITQYTDMKKFINPIKANCSSTTTCSPQCKNILTEFKEAYGCCVNACYNSTLAEVTGINATTFSILRDDRLFNLCGVSPPPLKCKQPTKVKFSYVH